MTKFYTLPLSNSLADLSTVGGKGASLARLVKAGLPVPDGFHITTTAYQSFVDENNLQARIQQVLKSVNINQPVTLESASEQIMTLFSENLMPDEIITAIKAAYVTLAAGYAAEPDESAEPISVAVRSSATTEDLSDASFAGQQETFLNVRGVKAVLDAVKHCWASLWTARAIGYRVQVGADRNLPKLAVVVQKLVPADVSGIMFTANPTNGNRDQLVINASWGLGEAVVGGLVSPDSFTVDKTSHTVLTRVIADKQTMTVRTEGGTELQPTPEARRRAPVLDDTQAVELAYLGIEIEGLYGTPMDIEWTLVKREFAIVQARPITALPEASDETDIEPPTEWKIPHPKAMYSRSSVVELLPDPLTPLYATMGIRAVNAGTMRLFIDLVGQDVLQDDMVITINNFAYIGLRMTAKFGWRLLTRVWGFLPHFIQGEVRWREQALPQYLSVIKRWQERPVERYSPAELFAGAYEISSEAVNIYNVYQSGVVGLAMLSEMLFTAFYEKFIQRENDPLALTMILGGNSVPIQAEKSLYDVAIWCRERPFLSEYLVNNPVEVLARRLFENQPPEEIEDEWSEWQKRFQTHLDKYGHTVYDLDFSKPVPADNPAVLLGTLKMYLNDQGTNPYERQIKQIERRDEAAQKITSRLKGLRLKWFKKLLGWAQKYIPMREDNLADIGLGYPLLRKMLRELGRQFVQAGILDVADDIFWLYEEEIDGALLEIYGAKPKREKTMAETIHQRQVEWRAAKRITPPVSLPERSGLMKLLERFMPAAHAQEGDIIKGIGASPGCITLPACVLQGPEDFEKMQPGAALVAAITTPAWTPLFAMASAIVTDVGGPLSHGSIVAREYGIPAVLGTGVSTKRIQSGQLITVDGDAGTVTLLD